MTPKAKTPALPDRIYVKRVADANDPTSTFLVAEETIDRIGDHGEVVGLYVLKETRTLHVSRELK